MSWKLVLRHVRLRALCLGAISIASLAVPCAAWGQTAPLRLVSTAWPPFTNAPGQPRFALDLVEAALTRSGVTTNTTIVDEAKFTPSLVDGPFDGSAAAWKDAERERVLLFSEPYLENRLILLGRRGSDVAAKSLGELAGKRILIVGGYSYGDAVSSVSAPVFVRSRSEEDSLAQLLAGKAEYTLMDELVVEYILRNHGDQARSRLQIGSTPLITRSLHLAIRRARPDAASIVTRFNAELPKMIADRTYHRLLHVDWIRADVDGDGRLELVARTDQVGAAPPVRSYDLFTTSDKAKAEPTRGPRFYVGGNTYENWISVPENYKGSGRTDQAKPPEASSGTIFRFSW